MLLDLLPLFPFSFPTAIYTLMSLTSIFTSPTLSEILQLYSFKYYKMKSSCGARFAFLILFLFAAQSMCVYAGSFHKDVQIHWGDGRGKILDNLGNLLSLSLDKSSGSGFQSNQEFLYGKAEVQMKLVPGNSAGTVATFYLKSPGTTWDEIDFEFLGNISGHPYTLHTNVYTQGSGDKEQQFHLWFDPTIDFHTYCITWNPQRVIFTIDGIPIREFKNSASIGVPFPNDQPMRLYASLWEAEHWATRGGLEKTDWSKAPFTAFYRNYNVDGCVWVNGKSSCSSNSPGSSSRNPWFTQELDFKGKNRVKWAQRNYMVYNYCTDKKRFPQGAPPECS